VTRTILVLVSLVALVAAGCSTGTPSGALNAASPSAAASAGAGAGAGAGSGACPKTPPPALAKGEKRVVSFDTSKGAIKITVEADLGPLAAGNFVALVSCGFYDGLVFHRLVPGFVIQGGDPTGTGGGGPGYEFADDPVTVPYVRGVVAMANAGADTNGSQFFIVLDTITLDPNYSVFGRVTEGMDAVDAIAAMPNEGQNNLAVDPVAMDHFTISTP
jgi:cyclophilin family peptidyl-prolyl cis-trans isomerase